MVHLTYMATTKDRINVSVSKETREALEYMAKRDQKPLATKTAELLDLIIDIEEDRYFGELAEKRLKQNKGRWLSHEEVWGKRNLTH